MVMSLILLLAIVMACALTLGRGASAAQQAHVPQPRAAASPEHTDVWRPESLEGNAHARALRLATAYSLDATDGRVPVRVTL